MSMAAQPLTAEDPALSPWWLRTMLIVMVVGFAGLIAITSLAYRNAPPIPAQVVDAQGAALFSGDDIRDGQAVFLKYGLMDNGSIWGHGAYLGPDYSAEALHRIGEDTAAAIAQQHTSSRWRRLTPAQQAAVRAETARRAENQSLRCRQRNAASDGTGNGRLSPADRLLDRLLPRSRAQRRPQAGPDHRSHRAAPVHRVRDLGGMGVGGQSPGRDYSYTNNFPYDPSVGNTPTPDALLWSALSLIVLLAGIAAVLLAFGKFDYLGWISRGHHIHPHLVPGEPVRASARW